MRWPRMTTRRWMVWVALIATIIGAPVECARWVRYYDRKAAHYELMEELCESECLLFENRAATCRAWSNVPWNHPTAEAETLRICPYPDDVPRHGSWAEQAAIWDRAAARGRITQARYHWLAARARRGLW